MSKLGKKRTRKIFKKIKKPVSKTTKSATKFGKKIGKTGLNSLKKVGGILQSPLTIILVVGVGAIVASKML